ERPAEIQLRHRVGPAESPLEPLHVFGNGAQPFDSASHRAMFGMAGPPHLLERLDGYEGLGLETTGADVPEHGRETRVDPAGFGQAVEGHVEKGRAVAPDERHIRSAAELSRRPEAGARHA